MVSYIAKIRIFAYWYFYIMEQTLIRQNKHWSGQKYSELHNRSIMNNLLSKKSLPHIQILTGVRRCGKSTVFKLLINDLIDNGADPKSILNLNLDAPAYIPAWKNPQDIRNLIDTAGTLTNVKADYLFLDEVQQVDNWELFVKSLYDTKSFKKIYATGSNSNMLQSRFAAMLSGRYFENKMHTFSLAECLSTKGINNILQARQEISKTLRCFNQSMKYGTFPEIVLGDMNDDIKLELLQSYFESIVQKDCIVYNHIRDIPSFYRAANYVFTTVGSRTTPQQLAKACGSNENTVANYLNYLQDSHVCTQIRNFSYSQKETKRSLRKCYPCDNGIMLANAIRFSADNGSFFENAVFNELVKSGYHDISFYDGKNECDFIAVKDAKFHAFQATFELNAANIGRETAGLDIQDINLASKTILTANQKFEYGNVRVLPLWEFAIENGAS